MLHQRNRGKKILLSLFFERNTALTWATIPSTYHILGEKDSQPTEQKTDYFIHMYVQDALHLESFQAFYLTILLGIFSFAIRLRPIYKNIILLSHRYHKYYYFTPWNSRFWLHKNIFPFLFWRLLYKKTRATFFPLFPRKIWNGKVHENKITCLCLKKYK